MAIKHERLNSNVRMLLRAKREQLKYSQDYLAELCDLSGNYIGNIERGEHSPTLDVFFTLCYALELDPAQVIANAKATMA